MVGMITTDDYLGWDGVAMGARVRAGDVTADELAAACCERIAEGMGDGLFT